MCGDHSVAREQLPTLSGAALEVAMNKPQSFVWTQGQHIPRSLHETLSPAQQLQIDPHFIEEDSATPIVPEPGFRIMSDAEVRAHQQGAMAFLEGTGGGGAESGSGANVPVLPDFFPTLDGSPYFEQTNSAFPGRTLLRFGTTVNNQGLAPAILTSNTTTLVNPDGTQTVLQRMYNFNQATNQLTVTGDRVAGRFTYHSAHSHMHYDGYARYRLMQRNPNGTVGPVAVRTDGTQVDGEKVGFCLINIDSSFTMESGQSSTTLASYNASQPGTGCGLFQGVHVGHADVYSASLDGQWIDVTSVPNGQYFIELTLDAIDGVVESNETNNVKYFPVSINLSSQPGTPIAADRFDQVGNTNNTPATATNLGQRGVSSEAGLTAHFTADDDYFKFTATSTGTGNVQLRIANGDMDLYLYSANPDGSIGAEIGRSTQAQTGSTTSIRTETVNASFVEGNTYYVLARAFNERLSNNYSLETNVKPTVRATVSQNAAEVGNSAGSVAVTRNGPVTGNLTVTYTVGGTATPGVDYISLPGTLVFDVESSTKLIDIIPLVDSNVESTETIVITFSAASAYVLGISSITVNLTDVGPVVSANRFANEAAPAQLDFDFSLNVGASFDASDVVATLLSTGQTFNASRVAFNTSTNTGTAFFDALPNGDYRADLSPAGITHALGAPLQAGVSRNFHVLAGDVNNDRSTNFADLVILARNFNTSGKLFSQGNVNRDPAGLVNFDDLVLIARNFNVSLAPLPILGGGESLGKGSRNGDLLK
jgi:Lysyl oxidase/Calx-beta domain